MQKTIPGRLMDVYVHGFVTPFAPIILLYVAFSMSKLAFFAVSLIIMSPMLVAVVLMDTIGVNFGLRQNQR
ncbi:MAG: hypothetical protein KDB27_31170 [Planctomycetales bacterium]|nr:hypothetical protein [Planctomycetales bacterium]